MTAWANPDELDFYALKCTPGKERMVSEILQNRQILARTPMQKYIYAGKHTRDPIERSRPLLAGLVFVAFPQKLSIPWFAIKKLHVVLGVIGMNHMPARLDHAGLMRLFDDLVFTTAEVTRHKRVYQRGDRVRVINGPFAGFNAEVDLVNPTENDMRIMCDIFGRSVPVRIEQDQLDMIEPLETVAA